MASATKQPITVHHRHANGTLAVASVYAPRTAVGARLAYAYGDLATGTVMYACHDQLGSVRRWRTPSKGNWGANAFEPYGEAYAVSTLAPRDYALHEWDPALAVYRAPYRNYSPTMTRWTTRDPLGMIDGPNMYGYVGGRTIAGTDPLGLRCGRELVALVATCGTAALTLVLAIERCYSCVACIALCMPTGGIACTLCGVPCGGCVAAVLGSMIALDLCMLGACGTAASNLGDCMDG